MSMSPDAREPWPDLPLAAWEPTRDTLHMWTQIVGKTLLACSPFQNHWWHVTLRVSARGLASPAAIENGRSFDLELDLIDQRLVVRTSDGRSSSIPLAARPVRSFYSEYRALLAALGLEVHIWTQPMEVPDPIPFDEDEVHHEYDPAWAHRFWQVLRRCDAAFKDLAADYVGKQSPVHLFWGSLDLASTRFSGRRAPERAGADRMMREGYSHEVISFGFWPGGSTPNGIRVEEPVLYAYAAPEPDGFLDADVRPSAARYDTRLGEFVLPYAAVRAAPDPYALVRSFCLSAYEAGASLGAWDRPALERAPERASARDAEPATSAADHPRAP